MNDYAVVLDLEVNLGSDRNDPSPYNKNNTLAAIGYTIRSPHGYLVEGNTDVVILDIEDSDSAEFDWAYLTFKETLSNVMLRS